jgi:hypothetical protein
MSTATFDEVWSGLRNAFLADAALAAMLGSPDAIYREFPRIKVDFPIITLDTRNRDPQTQISGTGVYRPVPQWNVFAVDPAALDQIFSHLEAHWSIPTERAEPIETEHYLIGQLRWEDPVEVGTVNPLVGDEWVYHLAIESPMRVLRKNGAGQ